MTDIIDHLNNRIEDSAWSPDPLLVEALRRQQLYKDAAAADDCHQLVSCDPRDILSLSFDLNAARAAVRMLVQALAQIR